MDDSSENSLPRIYDIQEGESVVDYLKRYTDEDLKVIVSVPTLSEQLGENLKKTSEYIHGQPTKTTELQALWKEMEQMKNYGRLKQFVEELRFVRQKLLVALDDYATYIEKYTKILCVTRLVGSVGDLTGSVVGMFMKDSSTFDYSDVAFKAATALGCTSTLSTLTEMYLLKNATDDIKQQIKRDENLYGPIEEWFQQTEGLQKAMLDVFPFEKTKKVLQDFFDAVDSEIKGADLLVNFFKKILETDIRQLRNADFLKNIMCLFSMSDIADLIKLVLFNPNQFHLEIFKMMLQLTDKSPLHMFYQHIPWISPCKQNFWSAPIWGRLTFNFMLTLHAFKTLKKSEIATLAFEMRYLRKHLEDQLKKLDEITNYVESQRNEAVNMSPR